MCYSFYVQFNKKQTESNTNMESQQFYVKFSKDTHSINIDSYSQYLSTLSATLKEINYQINGVSDISIEVIAQNPGSFEFLIKTIEKGTAFVKSAIGTVKNVVGIFVEVNEIKKKLDKIDGTKTEINHNNGTVTLKDNQNSVIHQTTINNFNVWNNPVVNNNITRMYQTMEEDDSITGYVISDENKQPVYEANRHEFESLSHKVDLDVQTETETTVVPAELIVSKIVLDNSNRKWGFIYGSRPINATIEDDAFWAHVFNQTLSFSNGDTLIADLEIHREYNGALRVFVETGVYVVKNVRDIRKVRHQEVLPLQ